MLPDIGLVDTDGHRGVVRIVHQRYAKPETQLHSDMLVSHREAISMRACDHDLIIANRTRGYNTASPSKRALRRACCPSSPAPRQLLL